VFERFTDGARHVVNLAQEEAKELGHNHVGVEHILLGLLREEDGLAAQVRIRWDDGHESTYTPASGALHAERRPKRQRRAAPPKR